MYVAPHVPLLGRLYTVPSGYAGIRATLACMRKMVNDWRTAPEIVSAARSIVFMEPAKDAVAEASALYRYVRDSVRYVQDVLGVETLATPIITLHTRSGDCDDQATLLATLLESIGYPTRFVVAGYSDPGIFEHVYLQVCIDGEWISCDTTERETFGWDAPDPVALMFEEH